MFGASRELIICVNTEKYMLIKRNEVLLTFSLQMNTYESGITRRLPKTFSACISRVQFDVENKS